MDDELVLLTSYFNLVDGRRQETADTFRVDPSLPSKTSPDGTAALYIVTEASAGSQMGTRARRTVADTIAWEYSKRTEEPPVSRLRAAFRAAHEGVLQEFDGHVGVGVSVIAVEGDTVYLGQVAPAQVYVLHDGGLHSIASTSEGNARFLRAIGSNAGPRISVFRDQVGPDDVLALCSSWFSTEASADEMRESFAAGTSDDIADSMLALVKGHGERNSTAIVIEAVLASQLSAQEMEDEPLSFGEQVDTAVRALVSVAGRAWDELRAVPPPEPAPNGATQRELSGSAVPVQSEEALQSHDWQASGGRDEAPALSAYDWSAGGRDATMEIPALSPDTAAETEYTGGTATARHQQGLTEEVAIVPPDEGDGAEVAHANSAESWPVEPEDTRAQIQMPPVSDPRDAPQHGMDATSEQEAVSQDSNPRQVAARPATRLPERTPSRDREFSSARAEEPLSEIEQVNARIQKTPDLGSPIPPVQAFADTSTVEPSRIYATSKEIQAANKRPRRFAGIARPVHRANDPLDGPAVIRPGDADVDLRRPVARTTSSVTLWVSALAFFLLAGGGAYLFLHHRHGGIVASNPYPGKAQERIAQANAAKTPKQQDQFLATARKDLGLARQNGSTPAQLAPIAARLQATADKLHHVTRVFNPTVLASFLRIPNARPAEVSAGPGIAYVLDTGRNSVFEISTNGGSTSGPSEITKLGDTISSLTIGRLLHTTTFGNTLLALDNKNQLVRVGGGVNTATPLTQVSQNPYTPASIATADPGDVYVLDTANSQVWYYPQGATGYNPIGKAYFDATTARPKNLNTAVGLALDGTDMFILGADGSIQKFDIQANARPFTQNLAVPLSHPVSIYTSKNVGYVWVADPVHARIVQMDKNGQYVTSYQSGSRSLNLRTAKSVAVGPAGNTLYVLVKSGLYSFPIAR